MSFQWFFIAILSVAFAVVVWAAATTHEWVLLAVAIIGQLYLAFEALVLAGAWSNPKPTDSEGE